MVVVRWTVLYYTLHYMTVRPSSTKTTVPIDRITKLTNITDTMSLRAKLRDIILDQFSIAPDQAESGENDVASSSFEKESVAVAPLAASPANHDEQERNPKKRLLSLPTVLTRNPKAVLSLDPQQLSSMLSSSVVSSSTRHFDFQCGPSPPRHEQHLPPGSDVCTSNAASLSQSHEDDNANYSCIQKLRREIANTIASDEVVGHSNMQCSHVNSSSSSFVTGGFTLLQAIKQQEQKEDLQHSPYPTTCSSPLKISTGSICLDRLLTSQEDPAEENMDKRFFNFDATQFQNKKQKVRHGLPTGHGTGSKDEPDVPAGSVGIGWKKITQVSGPSSSGKTQLGLMLAVNMMILDHQVIMRKNKDTNHHVATTKRDYGVYYIASSCSGSVGGYGLVPLARRLRHLVTMLESKGGGNDPSCVAAIRQQILDGIVLDSARDGYELLARLLSFEQELHDRVKNHCNESDRQSGNDQIGMLLVIDSISGCLSPLLYAEGDGGVGAALLNEIHLTLRRISRFSSGCFQKYGVAVFVTNGMASDFKEGGRKPALGDGWRAADVHVLLEPGRDVSVVSQKIVAANDLKRVVMKSIYASCFLHKESRQDRTHNALNVGVVAKVAGSSRVEFGIGASGIVDL